MNWIDDIVSGIIDKYATNNIYDLCNCLDIKIRKLDSDNMLLYKKYSFYYRDFKNHEIIFIRNDLHPKLEEFILKHELGHALCHPSLLFAGYSNNGKLEKQANYFALKLSNIKFDKAELEGMTFEQIAAYINVPFNALKQFEKE